MMKHARSAVLLSCAATAPGHAQDPIPPSAPSVDKITAEPADGDRNVFTAGAAVAVLPSYEGSNDYVVIPGGFARGKLRSFNFFTRGTELYLDVVPDRSASPVQVDFGPVVAVNLNRTFWIRDRRVRALGGRRVALELGGFAGVSKTGLLTSGGDDRFSANLTYVHDVTEVNRSYVATPIVEYGVPLSRRFYVSVSASADYAGRGYAKTYFGVDAAGAARSGFPAFDPHRGFKNVTAGVLGTYAVRGDLLHGMSLFATGSYSRELNDFARSPVVSVAGDPDQLFGIVGVAFSF